MADSEIKDIEAFQERFDLREPATLDWLKSRICFLEEELNELKEAADNKDPVAVFDALLDLVYVAKGTAAIADLPWAAGWAEVHRSNMDKIPGGRSHRLSKDMIKPEGWVGPRLEHLANHWGIK